MSVKELIKTAMNKDATEFEAKFNDIMADKMTSAIENKYTDMFQPEAAENIEVATDEE